MQTIKTLFITLLFLPLFTSISQAQWTPINTGSTTDYESFYFFDEQNGFTCGWSKIEKTSNGGQTWTTAYQSTMRDLDFVDATFGYAAGVSGSSMRKTVNGGQTWTNITPINSNSLWGVSAVSASTAYFCGTGRVVWKTVNGGLSLSPVNIPSSMSETVVDIDFIDASTGFALAEGSGVWKTTNGGANWVNTSPNVPGVGYSTIYMVNANTGYAVGSSGTVLKTIDGGNSWAQQNTGSGTILSYVHFYDPNHGIVVGYGGTILRTNNGGDTWVKEDAGTTAYLKCCYMLSPSTALVAGDDGVMFKNTGLSSASEELGAPDAMLAVFPNPSKGVFTIQSEKNISKVQVFDANGSLLVETPGPFLEGRIDLSNQEPGVYFVAIESGGQPFWVKVLKE